MTVAEGSDVRFHVDVANNDIDEVHWEINGKPIRGHSTRTSTTSSGQTFSLAVRDVNKTDEAAYSCIAGSTKSIARLYVEGKFFYCIVCKLVISSSRCRSNFGKETTVTWLKA